MINIKNKSPFVPAILFAVFFAMVSFSGCEKVKTEPVKNDVKLTDFKVSECKTSLNSDVVSQNGLFSDTIYAETVNDSTLKVWTVNTIFPCCLSEITPEITMENSNIFINLLMSDDGKLCNCLCGYDIEFLLNGLITGQKYSVTIIKDGVVDYYSFDFTFSNKTHLTFNLSL